MTSSPRLAQRISSAVIAAIALAASPSWAAITPTGDVSPASPSTWTSSTTGFIGTTSDGTITVNGGSTLLSALSYVGYGVGFTGTVTVTGTGSSWKDSNNLSIGFSGNGYVNIIGGATASCVSLYLGDRSTGTLTVDGNNSKWTCSSQLLVGYLGNGTLNITNRGQVVVASSASVASHAGATGLINFGANGGTLTCQTLYATPAQLTGTGTISEQGLVSDVALVFDGTHGLTQTLTLSGANQNVAMHLDMSGSSGSVGALGAGYGGNGSLTIKDGVKLTSHSGYLGYSSGSTGTAIVDGSGSTWTTTTGLSDGSVLQVGRSGAATLSITNGGKVSSAWSQIGLGATATATVDGTGSTWTTSGALEVDGYGSTLAITHGAVVSCAYGYIGRSTTSAGTATVDGTGSTWTNSGYLYVGSTGAGSLAITNGGIVTVSGPAYVAYDSTATGSINFGTNGGTLSTQSLYALPAQFTGTGTIYSRGMVLDGTLTFDATHGASQMLVWAGDNQNVTVNLDLSGGSGAVGDLGAGFQGSGTLAIKDGLVVKSVNGFLGYKSGSTGTATVDGAGSTWNISGSLNVGYSGTGTLRVTNRGIVNVAGATYIAANSAGTGFVDFGASGGTLTTQMMYGAPGQFTGTGTINARGIICDGVLTLNATQGTNQVLTWLGDNQNVTLNLDLSGATGTVGDLGAGYKGAGTLSIQGGMNLTTSNGYLGYLAGSTGTAIISGSGSNWTTTGVNFYVGNAGTGMLIIASGGVVSNKATNFLGYSAGAVGTATISGPGSTWTTTGNYLYVGDMGIGTLRVINGGKVSNDIGSYVGVINGGIGTVTVDGSGSTWSAGLSLFLGSAGAGNLNITHGGLVSDSNTHLGTYSGASGVATVDGTGSIWNNYTLYVGDAGIGSLSITNAGVVNCISSSYLGYSVGATGTASVDGSGSLWSNKSTLYIGKSGSGTLIITRGGQVTSASLSIGTNSLLAMSVGDGSALNAGTGSLANSGTVRLTTVSGATAGTYTPITAASWSGTGAVQALGGIWSTASHTFTVSPAAFGTAGLPVTIDPSQTQRIVIIDPSTSTSTEAGFQPTATSSSFTLTASPFPSSQSTLLQTMLAAGSAVLTGWNFTTSGYTPGNPVALSLQIGTGYASANLAVWQFNGAAWAPFAAPDLSYNGTHASFTVTSLTPYALASPLIPTTLSSGITLLTAHNMLPKITDLTLCACTLNLNGFNQQLNSLCDGTAALLTNTSPTPSTLTLSPASPTNTTFAGNITGNLALTKSGPGTLTLANYQATGPLTLTAGTLAFSPNPAPRHTPAVLLQSSALSVSPNTTLDLSNHDLLLHNANPAQIESLLSSAYFFGLWTHPGITSSSAQANPTTTLAIMSGTDYNTFSPTPGTFDNTPVASTDTVLKFTYVGDLNLDGLVNDDDLFIFNGAYFFGGTGNYALGDLNFDGLVNDDDLFLFNGNYFFPPATTLADLSLLSPSQIENQNSKIENLPTPEPATLLLFTLAAPLLLLRRPRIRYPHLLAL